MTKPCTYFSLYNKDFLFVSKNKFSKKFPKAFTNNNNTFICIFIIFNIFILISIFILVLLGIYININLQKTIKLALKLFI